MKNVKKLLLTGILSTLIAAPAAYAVNADGDEGITSTGTSELSCTVPKLVKITGIDGIAAPNFDGNTALDGTDDVCIFSNMVTGGSERYRVTINSANPADNTAGFYLGNAANDQEVLFTVKWNDDDGTNTGESAAMTEGTALVGQDGFDNSPTCGGNNNARYHVQATAAALLAVRPGAYTATLTILIEPV